MKQILYRLLFTAIFCLALAYHITAQSIYTTTWVGPVNFPGGTQIVGTATSSMDYSTQPYYCITAWAYLYRDGDHITSEYASNNCDPTLTLIQAEALVPDDHPDAEYVIDGEFTVTPYYTGQSDSDYYNYQTYFDAPYFFEPGAYGFLGPGPSRPDVGSILLGVVYNYLQQGTPPGQCNDARDTIRREYVTHMVNLRPICANFTQNRHSTYFTFNELNTGNFAWALIRDPLIIDHNNNNYGLDEWRVAYGIAMTVNSAYRNPARNAAVGGARNSRHMYGDAADIRNVSGTINEYNNMAAAAGTANADYIEPWTGPCGNGCVHADWRNHAGGY